MMEYRPATEADIPGMVEVRNAGSEHDQFMRDRIGAYMTGEHHPRQALAQRAVFVAVAADTVIGYGAGHLTRRHDCDGELQWMYVRPDHRGTEVAPTLLRLVAGWFARQRAARICVNVDPANAAARRFYARHGARELTPQWLVWENIQASLGGEW